MSARHALALFAALSSLKGGVLIACAVTLVAILGLPGDGAAEPTFDLGVVLPIAVTDGAAALAVNPAALSFRSGAELFLSRSATRAGLRFQNAVVKAGSFELGWQEWRDFRRDIGQRRFSSALSAPLGRHAWVGLALHRFRRATGPFRSYTTLDLGALVRPARWLSLGAVVRDPARPTDRPGHTVDRRYAVGLALRPFGWGTTFAERVTLAADMTFTDGRDLHDEDIQFYAMTELVDGLALDLSVRGDGMTRVALALSGRNGRLALSTALDDEGRAASRFGVIHLSGRDFRPLPLGERRVLGLGLKGKLGDVTPQWSLLGGGGMGLDKVRKELERARRDRRVGAIFVEFDGFRTTMGIADELRRELASARAAGVPVIAYARQLGTLGYYVASAADSIVFDPIGELNLLGLRAEVAYFARAFEKLGIEIELERIGKYKAAAEQYTAEGMSAEHREQLDAILDERYAAVVTAIAEARGVGPDSVRALIDAGPHPAEEALAVGLVDRVSGRDDARLLAQRLAGLTADRPRPLLRNLGKSQPRRRRWTSPPRVAVIEATGVVTAGRAGTDPLTGVRMLGADTIGRAIRRAREDSEVRALVLRIDSGGGTVEGSDLIWREVEKVREAGKPVVASIGGLAASGAYYFAAPSDRIVANPGAIVGSIGVFAGKAILRNLYEKVGVHVEMLARGEQADLYSPQRPFTPKQRTIIRRSVERYYQGFVERVAAGRGLTETRVDSLGQGRIYTAMDAQRLGLVDELGGLAEAIEEASALADLDEPPEVVVDLSLHHSALERLGRFFGRSGVESLFPLRRELSGVLYWWPMDVVME